MYSHIEINGKYEDNWKVHLVISDYIHCVLISDNMSVTATRLVGEFITPETTFVQYTWLIGVNNNRNKFALSRNNNIQFM